MCQVAATHSGVKEAPRTRAEARHHGRERDESSLLSSAAVPALSDAREKSVVSTQPSPKPELAPPTKSPDSAARHSGTTEQPTVRKSDERRQRRKENRAHRAESKPEVAGSGVDTPKIEKGDTRKIVSRPPEIKPPPAKKPNPPVTEVKKPEAIKPVEPLRRQDYISPAGGERKIVNFGSVKPKSALPEQPIKAEITEALRKSLAQILTYAADEEKRLGAEIYAKKDEEKSRIIRLHSVIFQTQPTISELGESNRLGVKLKILNELKVIFGDKGFQELKLPTFLAKHRNI